MKSTFRVEKILQFLNIYPCPVTTRPYFLNDSLGLGEPKMHNFII